MQLCLGDGQWGGLGLVPGGRGTEEAFARRNFGNDHGKLYKPDYRFLNAENADVALRYIDDNPDSYPGIFENAKFKGSEADQKRVIEALKTLSTGENLEIAVNVDEVLRYFTVQVFVMNWDSYLGHTGHNYFCMRRTGSSASSHGIITWPSAPMLWE